MVSGSGCVVSLNDTTIVSRLYICNTLPRCLGLVHGMNDQHISVLGACKVKANCCIFMFLNENSTGKS